MRHASLLLAVLSTVALGQAQPPALSATTGVKRAEVFAPSGGDVLYVDSTGNNSGTCTSTGAGACATLQGALDKLAKFRNAPATITIATGTYAGAVVSGFNVAPSRSGASNAINIVCTLQTATGLATGSATGTLTGFSAASGSTFAVFTDSNATLTANDLRGRLIEITAGTGSGVNSVYVITSNTATAITVAGSVTTSASGATYVIRDWGTTISTLVAAEAGGPFSVSNMTAAGLKISGNQISDGNFGTNITVQRCAFDASTNSASGVIVESNRAALRWNKFKGTGTFYQGVFVNRGGGANIQNSYFELTSSGIGVGQGNTNATAGGTLISNSFMTGGTTGVLVNGPILNVSGSLFRAHTGQAFGFSNGFLGAGQITNSRIDCNSAGGNGIHVTPSSTAGGAPVVHLGISALDISNCATAVNLGAAGSNIVAATLTGSSNTTGLLLAGGARAKLAASVTLTGTTEVSIDGTGNDLATMRAASPKLITTTYGTIYYE